MNLRGSPLLGVVAEGDPAGPWVYILASDQRRDLLVEPPLRIDLPVEVLRVLPAVGVAVAGAWQQVALLAGEPDPTVRCRSA